MLWASKEIEIFFCESGISCPPELSRLSFDHRGLLAKVTDPLGNFTPAEFNNELRPSRLDAPTGVWAAMKAELTDRERADVPSGIELFHVEPLTVPGLDARRCLAWMRRRRD